MIPPALTPTRRRERGAASTARFPACAGASPPAPPVPPHPTRRHHASARRRRTSGRRGAGRESRTRDAASSDRCPPPPATAGGLANLHAHRVATLILRAGLAVSVTEKTRQRPGAAHPKFTSQDVDRRFRFHATTLVRAVTRRNPAPLPRRFRASVLPPLRPAWGVHGADQTLGLHSR